MGGCRQLVPPLVSPRHTPALTHLVPAHGVVVHVDLAQAAHHLQLVVGAGLLVAVLLVALHVQTQRKVWRWGWCRVA